MLLVAKNRIPSGFGGRLRDLREAAGLTQKELGEKAGMLLEAVSRLERGVVEPNWPTVLKLADALGVDVGEFRGDGPPD